MGRSEIHPMWNAMDKRIDYLGNRRLIARWALASFIFGPIFPFIMNLLGRPAYSSDVPLDPVVGLSLLAEFLALTLGFLGRRHLSGRVAMFGALIILGCAFLIPVLP